MLPKAKISNKHEKKAKKIAKQLMRFPLMCKVNNKQPLYFNMELVDVELGPTQFFSFK